jgi:hypothetical protein
MTSAPDMAAAAVQEARALAGAGQYRQAVDLLSAQPGESLDLESLRDLAIWRNAAFDPEAGVPAWPPRYADPFPGVRRPPEIHGAALTADLLGGAIQHHGCLLVRDLIEAEHAQQLAGLVRQAFQSAEASRSGAADPAASPWYAPFPLKPGDGMNALGRGFAERTGGVWTADSPRALADFVAFLNTHGVIRIIEAYLGERAFLSIGKSTLRIATADTDSAFWHQDGAFLGPDVRTVNIWLALSDCGEDAPGLDIYPRRLGGLAETGTRGARFDWCVSDAVIAELAETAPVVAPRFKAGDALLFDQLFLHRTGTRPHMTKERLAIESWFFAGSTFPMEQMPLAL